MTADLVEFLNARYDEAEAAAKACAEVYPPPWDLSDRGYVARVRADEPRFWVVAELEQHPSIDGWLGDRLDHIARNNPAYVLADIAAKRRIVEYDRSRRHGLDWDDGEGDEVLTVVLRMLASVYSDHEDYQSEWKA